MHCMGERNIQFNELRTNYVPRTTLGNGGLKREAYMVWKMFDPYELTGLFWDGMNYALGSFLEEAGGGMVVREVFFTIGRLKE